MNKIFIILLTFLLVSCGQLSYNLEHNNGELQHITKWKVVEFDFNRLYKKDTRLSDYQKLQNDLDVMKAMILELKEKYQK